MTAKFVHGCDCCPGICHWIIALHGSQATHVEPTTCVNMPPWIKRKEKNYFLFFIWEGEEVVVVCVNYWFVREVLVVVIQHGNQSSTVQRYPVVRYCHVVASFCHLWNLLTRQSQEIMSCNHLFWEKTVHFPSPFPYFSSSFQLQMNPLHTCAPRNILCSVCCASWSEI